jgi:Outer membrane protein beta-barrel domain
MKKVIAILAGISIAAVCNAQLSLGVQGIGNLGDMKITTSDAQNLSKKMKAMPGGGLTVQYGISNRIAIRSGVNFLQQGTKLTIDSPSPGGDMPAVKATADITLNYLQVPVYALYTINLSKLQFFAGGGGYVNYGIGGKLKSKGVYVSNYGTEAFEEKTDPFKSENGDNAAFKRTELGVGAIAGLRLPNGLFANIGYQLGLSNISNQDGDTFKNRGLQLSIGYFFR